MSESEQEPQRCAEPECNSPVVMDHGYCFRHSPDPADQERAAAASLRGAMTTKARRKRGLDHDELGPLKSPGDAERWCQVVGLAVATGRLSGTAAQAVLRAVSQWQAAREAGELAERLARLEQAAGQRLKAVR